LQPFLLNNVDVVPTGLLLKHWLPLKLTAWLVKLARFMFIVAVDRTKQIYCQLNYPALAEMFCLER